MPKVTDALEREVERQVLRYAVSHAITCACGDVLDVARAVLVDAPGRGAAVVCGRCWVDGVRDLVADVFPDAELTLGRDVPPAPSGQGDETEEVG